MRTVVVWVLSIAVGWQAFHYLQLLGFAVLVTGICMYNEIIPMPHCGAGATKGGNTEVGQGDTQNSNFWKPPCIFLNSQKNITQPILSEVALFFS